MAQTTLTVYAYGNVDSLHGMFNAVAMVMGSGDFADMIRVAVLIGFLVVGILAINPSNLSKGWNWFICVAVLTGVVLTPKATVTIEDKLGQQPPAVVENVPWLLGVFASVKSSIGATLTELFETAFQAIPNEERALPSQLSYLEHGVVFGNRLIRGSREAEFSALNAQGDTLNYLRNCIFPSLGREEIPGSFERSTSLIDEISDPNPALFSSYHDDANGGGLVVAPCDKVFPHIRQALNGSAGDALKMLSARLMPHLDVDQAQAKVTESLEAIYGKTSLAALGSTAQDIMIQNVLINATADASALYGASLDDPAVLMLASMRSQAVGSMNAGYLVQGRVAEEALPIVRNITEAILYAVFPILCILAIASEGRALASVIKGYLYTLIWVELWPPMFAVVNYLQTLHSAANLQAAGTMPSALGLSLQTATGVYSTAVSDVAITSWMVTFVPLIAGAVLFGMDRLMSITGTRPGAPQADSEAAAATKGNLTMGNVMLDQQHIDAYRSSPAMMTNAGVGGQSIIDMVTGSARYQHAQSSGPVNVSDMSSLAREQARGASHSLQLAQSDAKVAEESVQSAISRIDGLAKSGAFSTEASQAWHRARDAAEREDSQDARSVAEKIAKQFGTQDVAGLTKGLSAGLSLPKLLEMVVPLNASGKVDAGLRSQASRFVGEEMAHMHDRRLTRSASIAEAFTSQASFREGHSADTRALEDVRTDLQNASTFRESSTSRLDEARQFQDTERKLNALQHSWTINNANAFYEFAAREGKHPGNANITRHEWAVTLQQFLDAGEVGRDDDGEFFMPQIGQGPNILQNNGPESLSRTFGHSNPGGGSPQVIAASTGRRAEVRRLQRNLGVSSNMRADGSAAKRDVDAATTRISGEAKAAEVAAETDLVNLQVSSDAAFENAAGQAGSLLHSMAADRTGHGIGVDATHVDATRPRPGKAAMEAREADPKRTNSRIPNE